MKKRRKKKGKRIKKNNRATRERGRPTKVYERKEESVRMCVRRCVRNFEKEEEEEDNAYVHSRRTVICLFYTQHTLIRKSYIHTYTHTHTLVQKEREKNVRALLRRVCTLSALLLYYYRVTPYVCLY